MKTSKYLNIVLLSIIVVILISKIIGTINTFPQQQELLKAEQKYADILNYNVDIRELVGTDVNNKQYRGQMLTPGMAINDISSLGVSPGEHKIQNIGITPLHVRVNGQEVEIKENESYMTHLSQDTVIAIVSGYAIVI